MTVQADLVEARGRLDATSKKLNDALVEGGGVDLDLAKIKSIQGDDNAKVDQIRAWKEEEDALGKQVDTLAGLVKIAEGRKDDSGDKGMKHRTDEADTQGDTKRALSLGEQFVKSDAYTKRQGDTGPISSLAVKNVKTLFQTSAGWAPESVRSGVVVDYPLRPMMVSDLFPTVRTSQASYVYMEETTFTNNAAEAAETGTYAESALALTQRSVPVQKVATFIPVTDEQMEDVDGIQSYIDQRLGTMLAQRIDSQLLVGDGTPPNIRGVNNAANIQTQALGADVTPDAIYKAMTLVRVTGRANPSGIIMHPTDWQDIKLLRSSDGIYIWGNPADNNPDRIWGVNVVITDAQTLNTAIVGDFANYSLLVQRRDVEVQMTNAHSTYFIEGKVAIRADVRLCAIYLRGTAFCKVTGV